MLFAVVLTESTLSENTVSKLLNNTPSESLLSRIWIPLSLSVVFWNSLTFDLPVKRENYKSVKHHIIFFILFRGIQGSEACSELNSCVTQLITAQTVSFITLYKHTHKCAPTLTHTRQKGARRLSVCMSGDTRYLTFSDGRALKAIIGNVLRDRREYL